MGVTALLHEAIQHLQGGGRHNPLHTLLLPLPAHIASLEPLKGYSLHNLCGLPPYEERGRPRQGHVKQSLVRQGWRFAWARGAEAVFQDLVLRCGRAPMELAVRWVFDGHEHWLERPGLLLGRASTHSASVPGCDLSLVRCGDGVVRVSNQAAEDRGGQGFLLCAGQGLRGVEERRVKATKAG